MFEIRKKEKPNRLSSINTIKKLTKEERRRFSMCNRLQFTTTRMHARTAGESPLILFLHFYMTISNLCFICALVLHWIQQVDYPFAFTHVLFALCAMCMKSDERFPKMNQKYRLNHTDSPGKKSVLSQNYFN